MSQPMIPTTSNTPSRPDIDDLIYSCSDAPVVSDR